MMPSTKGAGITTKYGAMENQGDLIKALLDLLGGSE